MAMKAKKDDGPTQIQILAVKTGIFDVAILGRTPLILHHGSVKQHLLPALKQTRVGRETTLKHEPYEEWRDCMICAEDGAPTRVLFKASAFKGAMMTAALRLPGAVKTEIAQLVSVVGEFVPIYGIPRVKIDGVRNSDIARTPDARTRPILGEWASRLTIEFVEPMMQAQGVANLLEAGGRVCGIGDWRPEKGKGTFGQFQIVDREDPRYLAVVAQGQAEQDVAIANPTAYDAQTLEVLTWYEEELACRRAAGRTQESRRKVVPAKPNGSGEQVEMR